MKKLFLIIIGIFLASQIFAQDIILLKNGTEIKAKILLVNASSVTYNTMDSINSSVMSLPKDQVFMITYANGVKEVYNEKVTPKTNNYSIEKKYDDVNLNDYGGKFSFGVALGGGGVGVGIPIMFYISPKVALELGAYARPVFSLDGKYFSAGVQLAGGPVVYFAKTYKPFKNKIVLNGMSLKGGYCFSSPSKINQSFVSLNWAREAFKKQNKNRSFIFELGAGVSYVAPWTEYGNWTNYYYYQERTKTTYGGVGALIYFKCNWNWYSKKKK